MSIVEVVRMSSLVGESDSESEGGFSSVAKMHRVSGIEQPEFSWSEFGLLGFHSKSMMGGLQIEMATQNIGEG